MPDSKKKARADKRPGAGKGSDAPLLGEAALQAALAGFAVSPNPPRGPGGGASSGNGSPAAAGAAPGQAEPPPKTVSQVLGEITWLMTQSPRHKALPLGDLEWLLMPAILLRQFRIFYSGDRPVGVALWALADDLVAKRIDAGDRRLSAVEWKSGGNLRILDIVAPFGGEAEMRAQVGEG
ncbi:toxin-activating lysine-acyltransferase [Bradyrhizobium sp.]|jgi:cytolysin-activating lysine-acyltransferase|uniref:toxin-activating lysine-acyltransferase n=1 Tax=Bradyrhizobium sp. TaxID=376 RepID=UPI002E0199D1|nr:toxin-activating lysine-acyltransferase [Bradyrhizobium sp.]